MSRHRNRSRNRTENKGKSWLKIVLLAFLISALLVVVGGIVWGYFYINFIESKLHPQNKNFRKVKNVISKPVAKEPVNILLLGSDARKKEESARADTMIIVRINPVTKRIQMISIPRDTRVKIPGKKDYYDKINAANALGGPELAIRTIEDFTGLSIHHYAEIHFWGFRRLVDALGGIKINVEKPLVWKEKRFGISAGYQLMDGDRALNYVRFRHDSQGDFVRKKKKQKFFYALIDESWQIKSIFKLPTLVNIVADNIQTDMTTREMFGLANMFKSVNRKDIEMITFPGTPKSINGVSYVIPDEEKISQILFLVKRGLSVNKTDGKDIETSKTKIMNKDIKVIILNGSGKTGAARDAGNMLALDGFNVLNTGNAGSSDYKKTVVRYRWGQYSKALKVKKYFPDAELESVQNGSISSDVLVILGKDSTGSKNDNS
ncbi:MAG: LCP family protein [Actinobacteria bacterium]|nr:LCP family protein [Actinomycetota bacterium]